MDGVDAYSIGDDVASTGHNEFAGPIDTAHSAQTQSIGTVNRDVKLVKEFGFPWD
jgi:hypothetical protein